MTKESNIQNPRVIKHYAPLILELPLPELEMCHLFWKDRLKCFPYPLLNPKTILETPRDTSMVSPCVESFLSVPPNLQILMIQWFKPKFLCLEESSMVGSHIKSSATLKESLNLVILLRITILQMRAPHLFLKYKEKWLGWWNIIF